MAFDVELVELEMDIALPLHSRDFQFDTPICSAIGLQVPCCCSTNSDRLANCDFEHLDQFDGLRGAKRILNQIDFFDETSSEKLYQAVVTSSLPCTHFYLLHL